METVHHIYVPDMIRLERRRYADGGKACTWEWKIGTDWTLANGLAMDTLPLYQQDQVVMAVASGEPVVVCESESSVDALMKAGFYATTWAGGASAPQVQALRVALAGGRVIVIPDNDPAGLACRDRIVAALHDICDLSILLPPPGRDARDLVGMWGSTRLRQAIANLPAGQSQQVLVTR
jgi:DNA primase